MADINPFFKKIDKGPKKTMTLQDALSLALGYCGRILGSKRLLPPMAIPNARIYLGKKFIWKGDLDIFKERDALKRVAIFFKTTLEVYSETGQEPEWSSKEPDLWLGFCFDLKSPQDIYNVYPFYERVSKAMVKQWKKDHSIGQRNDRKRKS